MGVSSVVLTIEIQRHSTPLTADSLSPMMMIIIMMMRRRVLQRKQKRQTSGRGAIILWIPGTTKRIRPSQSLMSGVLISLD